MSFIPGVARCPRTAGGTCAGVSADLLHRGSAELLAVSYGCWSPDGAVYSEIVYAEAAYAV
jgi:hypothetical protein